MTQGQAHKTLAVFFGGLAVVSGFFFLRTHWSRGTDLDVTGFFWLVENVGRLTLLLALVVCAATAVSYWIRGLRAGG